MDFSENIFTPLQTFVTNFKEALKEINIPSDLANIWINDIKTIEDVTRLNPMLLAVAMELFSENREFDKSNVENTVKRYYKNKTADEKMKLVFEIYIYYKILSGEKL